MSYITKVVQVRPPRPFTAKAVGRVARYSVGDGAKRTEVLGEVFIGLGYDLDCMHTAIRKLYQETLIAVSEAKDAVRLAIAVVRGLLGTSVIVKILGFLRRPLQALLLALEALDKILDDALSVSDVCADFLELVEVIRIYRGKQNGDVIR